MTFKFEKLVIDKILNIIKKNQVYLTQPENLPQLAKLGYMYDTLWYAGRICWGYDGILRDSKRGNGQCEDNPKYKIEMCKPQTSEIENLIYDASGMHCSMNEQKENWEEFSKMVFSGVELSKLQKNILKVNKTMVDWYEIFMSKDYKYSHMFKTKKNVSDYLLCTIGTGYGFKDGCIYKEASGADQDVAEYGDWKNATFSENIDKVIKDIMSISEVEQTIQAAHLYTKEILDKYNAEKLEKDIKIFGMSYEDFCKSDEYNKISGRFGVEKYNQYYPISDYSNISKIDENSDISYIEAGLEICEEILQHKKEEKGNIKFAETFINRFKK